MTTANYSTSLPTLSLPLSLSHLTTDTQFTPNYYKFYRGTNTEESTATMQAFIKRLEEAISANSGGFLSSAEAPGAPDYMVWPWFERLSALFVISPGATAVGQGRVGEGALLCACVFHWLYN